MFFNSVKNAYLSKTKVHYGGKVCFSNFMLLHICNNFDDLSAIVADFREVVGGLIDPPQYLYAQPIRCQKKHNHFRVKTYVESVYLVL